MLFIAADQVEYCQVTYSQDNQLKTTDGIYYRNKLFTKLSSFPKTEKHNAIEKAKSVSVENKGHFLVILVEESENYDVWQENHQVKLISQTLSNISVNDVDLEKLVTHMRNVGGIRIEDRWYKLRVYHRCFVGKEAVAWLMETLKISHAQAIKLGQRLVDEKWIHHVTNEHEFKDEHLFYRFYWDEKQEENTDEKLLDTSKIKKFFSIS